MHLDYFQYGQVWVKLSFWFRDKHLLVVSLYDTETGRALVTLSTLIPCMRAPFFDLFTSRKPHHQIPSCWGPGFQHMSFGGTQTFSP